jgi:hypothetical protein
LIAVFHANSELQTRLYQVENERELVNLVLASLPQYEIACRVMHSELDIAYAASGGETSWINADLTHIDMQPTPERSTAHGDILVEQESGFMHLVTPSGFIPLVDAIEVNAELRKKSLN